MERHGERVHMSKVFEQMFPQAAVLTNENEIVQRQLRAAEGKVWGW